MSIDHGPFVWFDGKLVRWDEATIHVASHVLHYGSSAFEGIRAYQTADGGTSIFRLEAHMKRLLNSCKIMRTEVPWTLEQLNEAVKETVANNGQPSCYIRPLIFRGMEVLGVDGRKCPTQVAIFSFSWGRYLGPEAIEAGIDVGVSSWRRLAQSTGSSLAKIGGQYINGQFAKMEAIENGYAEAVVLDTNGMVSEGSGENIFVVMDGQLITTPLSSSILSGVTRSSVMTIAAELGHEVREQALSRDMLYVADEVFFTGTAAEVTPIRSVDHIKVGSGKRGPITKAIQERFFAITSGQIPDKYGWLTPVKVQQPIQQNVQA